MKMLLSTAIAVVSAELSEAKSEDIKRKSDIRFG